MIFEFKGDIEELKAGIDILGKRLSFVVDAAGLPVNVERAKAASPLAGKCWT